MEQEYPVKEITLSLETINDMEQARVNRLNEAGIDEQEILSKANTQLNTWNSYFNENIVRGKDDMNFCLRDQWTAIERSEFNRLFKPAMTFNKIYDPVKKVLGEQRKNKPDLLVRSLTGKASEEQINLRADLVRTISYQSQNDLVYQTAFRSALLMGYGAYQISIDYESPMSFNRVITFDIIPDASRTFFDPKAIKPHKGDGDWCARNLVFGRDEFEATYPYVTNPVSFIDPYMLLDFQWETRDTIVICDYYVKEWFPIIIHKLSDGRVVSEEKWEQMQDDIKVIRDLATESTEAKETILSQIPTIVSTRQSQDYKIMHYRMIRNQILDFSEWPSKHLPLIFVDGDSSFIEGRQYTKSFIHEARDAQKCLNYFGSEIAADVKNRRREQWIATPDNIIGYEQQWRNPELQMGALMAKPDPKTGQMPMKSPAWELSPGLVQNMQRSGQDIREILGFSETEALQGRDMSGVARRERKMEGSMSAYVFFDNLNQAIEQGGRVILDLLPFVYGEEERSVVISKRDGQTKQITLNKKVGNEVENSMEAGEYDIEIDCGPSFAVQKEIALEFLQQTLQAFPQAFPLIADLWAKNLDVQFMPQIAERFKTMVPPEVLAKEAGEEPPPKQPNPQEMMMQMEMQNKQQQMEIERESLKERAVELQIRQEKHELEKAELIMKAKELTAKMGMDDKKMQHEMEKADLDFSAKIAKVLSDTHTKTKLSEVKER